MKKVALCSLLAILAPCIAFALEVGTFTDIHGLQYTREMGTLTSLDGSTRQVYREVYADGRSVLKDTNGAFTSGKGATFKPNNPTPPVNNGGGTAVAGTSAVNGAGVAMGALSIATGVVGMYDSVKEKDRKTTIGDVVQGSVSGAVTTAGGALIVNSIPAFGQIAYGAAVAAGAVAGATGAGLKMFSETDCALDQVLTQARGFNVYQCCHTSQKLSTITHANYWDIGAYMFCPQPGMVSQCVQQQMFFGNGVNRSSSVDNKTWDDKWDTCRERWCDGWERPANGEVVQYYADYDNYCWRWECADGKKREGNKCVPSGPVTPTDNCAKYKSQPEAYACCKYKYATWNEGTKKCECTKKTAEWIYNSKKGTGFCKIPGEPDPVDPVPGQTQQCLYTFSGDMQCANGARVSKNTSFYLNVDANKSCDAFRKEFNSDQVFMLYLLDKYCSTQVNPVIPPVQGNDQAFKDAASSLQSFFQSAKNDASVWKNADGKFNTARLASDLTAGVVLGTVGGVVSGVVIKKKQVEKGFDVLQCTVGGQKIADWGDEFEVGLRR